MTLWFNFVWNFACSISNSFSLTLFSFFSDIFAYHMLCEYRFPGYGCEKVFTRLVPLWAPVNILSTVDYNERLNPYHQSHPILINTINVIWTKSYKPLAGQKSMWNLPTNSVNWVHQCVNVCWRNRLEGAWEGSHVMVADDKANDLG